MGTLNVSTPSTWIEKVVLPMAPPAPSLTVNWKASSFESAAVWE
ncbi:MAG: hypothetical protein R2873_10310 [Caldilineaceae bacterium]